MLGRNWMGARSVDHKYSLYRPSRDVFLILLAKPSLCAREHRRQEGLVFIFQIVQPPLIAGATRIPHRYIGSVFYGCSRFSGLVEDESGILYFAQSLAHPIGNYVLIGYLCSCAPAPDAAFTSSHRMETLCRSS
jgi:hypothetical protein